MSNTRRKQIREQRLQAKRDGASPEEIAGLTSGIQIEADGVAWKKLKGDVHRNPKYPIILAFLLGTGTQVGVMTYFYLFTMALGLLHPYLKWTWIGSILLITIGAGYLNGYITARSMKTAGATDWVGGATAAAFVYPMLAMVCFVTVDIIEWSEKYSYLVELSPPVTSVMLYNVVWMIVNIFACYFGA